MFGIGCQRYKADPESSLYWSSRGRVKELQHRPNAKRRCRYFPMLMLAHIEVQSRRKPRKPSFSIEVPATDPDDYDAYLWGTLWYHTKFQTIFAITSTVNLTRGAIIMNDDPMGCTGSKKSFFSSRPEVRHSFLRVFLDRVTRVCISLTLKNNRSLA